MNQVQFILRSVWSAEFVSDSRNWLSPSPGDPTTLSLVSDDVDSIIGQLRLLVGDLPVVFCFHHERLENRLEEHRLRAQLPGDAEIVLQWDGSWVAKRWTSPVWHDRADLQEAFFVLDHHLSAGDVVADVTRGDWNTWASRDLALKAQYLVGTRAHPSGKFAASIISRHSAALAEARTHSVIQNDIKDHIRSDRISELLK